MTYCIGIKTNEGLVFASDSRTNAGLDNVNIYSKMFTHDVGDRTIVMVTSGNLGTSQAVYKSVEKDLKSSSGILNLNTCKDFEQIASYVGGLNIKHSSPQGINTDDVLLGSTFIIGGQIKGQKPELYLIYPQGNYIRPADSKPYLVIGEVKYGKPILDRVIKPDVSIGDASRCALISMDSTLKSDLTVGPPIDFAIYKKDENKLASLKCLSLDDEDYSKVCNTWSEGIFKVFDTFPRFDSLDSISDTPTNYGTDTGAGGEVRGNYCVLNSLARKEAFNEISPYF